MKEEGLAFLFEECVEGSPRGLAHRQKSGRFLLIIDTKFYKYVALP